MNRVISHASDRMNRSFYNKKKSSVAVYLIRGQAEKDFRMEVQTIGRVRHKNLVSLLGYCSEGACRYSANYHYHYHCI
jgi:hypothetical protein